MVLAWLNTLRSYLCGGNAVNKADLLEAFFTQSQAHFPPGIDFLMDNFKCIPSFIDLILQIEVHIAAESFHLHADESRQLVDNSSYKYLIHILLQSGYRNPSCTCSFPVCDDRNGLNRISLLKWHKKNAGICVSFQCSLTGSLCPFRKTLTSFVDPAISYALRDISATMSLSRMVILNLARSGWKVTQV